MSGTQVKIQFEQTIEKKTGGERAERRKGVSLSMNVVSQILGETRFGLSVQWYAAYCTEIRERKRENVNERLESDKKIKRYFISTLRTEVVSQPEPVRRRESESGITQ